MCVYVCTVVVHTHHVTMYFAGFMFGKTFAITFRIRLHFDFFKEIDNKT